MGRILGIDYGTKRTGIAVSDPLRIIASPLETVPTNGLSAFLVKYTAENPVDIIVVGKPLRLDGSPSDTFPAVMQLVDKLRKDFPAVETVLQDERFTSVIAQRSIIDSGIKKMKRRDKSLVDKVSAAVILRSYMDTLK